MPRRAAGACFVAMGVLLLSMTYLAAAIYGQAFVERASRYWPSRVMGLPRLLSVILFLVGVGYLVWGEWGAG
ncbi:MAG: hypothetical protein U9R48_01110 [Chloroflexota bacterium]|nr:hypothetical protein [Chloroflexota bacterium]